MNPALVGRVYPAVSFEVSEERAGAFARAVGEEGRSVPPTFLTAGEMVALAGLVADEELALDFSRVVHGEQEYEWRRPLRVGDVLSLEPRIAAIRSKGGHQFLVLESEVRDAGNEVVAMARCTLIERGAGA